MNTFANMLSKMENRQWHDCHELIWAGKRRKRDIRSMVATSVQLINEIPSIETEGAVTLKIPFP